MKMYHLTSIRAVLSGIVSFSLLAVNTPLYAQEESRLSLEEIVVTARKREENLQDIPISITAISGDDLEELGALDLTSASSISPNVQFVAGSAISGTGSAANVFIRGIGSNAFLINNDPGVGIYIDGVYVARNVGAILDLLDIGQLEVLRGPQGTLFGRNSNGGAISITSKKPSAGFEGSIALTFGENDHIGLKGSVNGQLAENLYARGSFLQRKRDGYVDALQYDDVTLGDDDVMAFRGQLLFEVSEKVDVTLSGDYTREREHGAAWAATAFHSNPGPGPFITAANTQTGIAECLTLEGRNTNTSCVGPSQLAGPYATNNTFYDHMTGERKEPESNFDIFGLSAVVNVDLDWAQFKSISAYRDLDADFDRSVGHSPVLVFQNPNILFESKSFTQEFQLTGSTDSLDWLVGLYYLDEDARQRPIGFNALNARFAPNTPDDRNIVNQALAFFTQGTWHANERLHLTLGARYTDEEKDFTIEGFSPAKGVQIFEFGGVQSDQEVTPHISARYDLTDNMNTYISYGEGFRSGTFAARVPGGDAPIVRELGLPSTTPEFVTTYEWGFKSTLLNDRLRFNIALFRTEYDDIQIEFTPGPPFSGQGVHPGNVATAEIDGFEFELTALLTSNLTLTANLGLLDAAYTAVDASSSIGPEDNLVHTPDYQGNIGLNYVVPFEKGDLITNLNWSFTDDQALQAQNFGRPLAFSDSWNRADLSISYAAADWTTTLHIKNLTGQSYVTSALSLTTPPFFTSEAVFNRPREAFATVAYRF